MKIRSIGVFTAWALLCIACGPAPEAARPAEPAGGAELHVMSSAGFAAALRGLVPDFQRTSGIEPTIAYGPSIGVAPDAIPSRMRRGEPVDVVVMAGEGLDALIERGLIAAGSRVDLARSRIGLAVRAGAPRPDISTVDAFRRALLDARSIAYSDSVSGIYISTKLLQRLGIADQVSSKSIQIPSEPVGNAVARGDAELGFQQMSELIPVAGIDVVGPIPEEVQKITLFSAGMAANARHPQAARALLRFMSSSSAVPAIARSGLEPIAPRH